MARKHDTLHGDTRCGTVNEERREGQRIHLLRNAQNWVSFVQSIRSILPIVDEFVIALGPSDDQTQPMLEAISDPKIRLGAYHVERMHAQCTRAQGFVVRATKSIALFNCTGGLGLLFGSRRSRA